jgi:EmrB/QacA subfamily drug resistance transporter
MTAAQEAAPAVPPNTALSETALSETAPPETAPPYRWRWVVLGLVLIAEIMDLVDATIVNVAGPSIQADLGGSTTSLQWILAGYTLAFAIALVTFGRLGDLLGRRRLFIVGAAGFTLASAACGLATSPELLIGGRVAQGLLGAVMIPQGLALIKAVFPPAEIGRAFAAFGPVMGLSAVGGPILAGVLLDADWFGAGWRTIFWINVPIGVAAIAGALKFMPELRTRGATRLDLRGVALLTIASSMLIYPLVQGRELGWPAWAFALMAASLPVFALFARGERRSETPVIEPGLFRSRGFVAGLGVILTFFLAMSGFLLVFNLFTQLGLHYSPLRAGLALVPFSLGIAVGAGVSGGVLAPRLGRAALQLGVLVMVVGMAGMWLTLRWQGEAATAWDFAPATAVAGLGAGAVFAPLFEIILASVDDRSAGSASGLLTAVQQFGGAVGVALIGTLFFELLDTRRFLGAMEDATLASTALFAVSFAATFLLPRRARADAAVH